MNFIEASDRREVELLPACLDDYISEDSPARDIDSFVESLNLHDCGFSYPKSDSQGRGRPSYHPKHLLKLFIYGYMNGLRSGRKLENSCQINMEVLWLMQKLKPDFKTICDFRKNNSEAFKKVAAQYSLFCYQQGHIDGKLLAVDGSRIKGLSAASKSWSKSKAKRLLIHLEKETSKYLDILAKADDCPVESDEQRLKHIKHKLKHLEKRKEEIHTVQKEMAESGTDYISHSDKEYGLILEDDVINLKPIKKNLNSVIKKFSKTDWDIVFLGRGSGKDFIKSKTKKDFFNLKYLKPSHPASNCAEAYVIKKESAGLLYEAMKKFTLPYDWEMAYKMYELDFKVRWFYPPIFKQGSQDKTYKSELR